MAGSYPTPCLNTRLTLRMSSIVQGWRRLNFRGSISIHMFGSNATSDGARSIAISNR